MLNKGTGTLPISVGCALLCDLYWYHDMAVLGGWWSVYAYPVLSEDETQCRMHVSISHSSSNCAGINSAYEFAGPWQDMPVDYEGNSVVCDLLRECSSSASSPCNITSGSITLQF